MNPEPALEARLTGLETDPPGAEPAPDAAAIPWPAATFDVRLRLAPEAEATPARADADDPAETPNPEPVLEAWPMTGATLKFGLRLVPDALARVAFALAFEDVEVMAANAVPVALARFSVGAADPPGAEPEPVPEAAAIPAEMLEVGAFAAPVAEASWALALT